MKSSLEEIKVKPQYVFTLELTEEELNYFYLTLQAQVNTDMKDAYYLSDDEFSKIEKINSQVFNSVRDAVMKINKGYEK